MQAKSVPTEAGAPKLKRELGQGMSTALVIGNMVGSGVFLLPASLAGVVLVSGSGSLLAWVLGGIVAMLLASVFANLGRAYPKKQEVSFARKHIQQRRPDALVRNVHDLEAG